MTYNLSDLIKQYGNDYITRPSWRGDEYEEVYFKSAPDTYGNGPYTVRK